MEYFHPIVAKLEGYEAQASSWEADLIPALRSQPRLNGQKSEGP